MNRGFKIHSCDCGEILIDYGDIKDDISTIQLPVLNDMNKLKKHYKFCRNCKEFVKVGE